MQIKVKKLNPEAILPTRGSNAAAGYDVYACLGYQKITIPPHQTAKIGTGLSFELPSGYFAGIYARSGLATKQGLRPANCVGICDSDYRGEYIVPLHNDSNIPQAIEHGARIAQVILQQFTPMNFEVVQELSDTERGEGGFGSTGIN